FIPHTPSSTPSSFSFFFNAPATTEIYTLSLHDALPIYDQLHFDRHVVARHHHFRAFRELHDAGHVGGAEIELRTIVREERCMASDRKSTRLNSSHVAISYAVFCLKKKKKTNIIAVVKLN